MQWKQRLYAFLLRRILGPILTSSSRTQLVHESVDVQLTEGKYLLRDVELDVEYLHSLLESSNTNDTIRSFQLQRVNIEKLTIQLSLIDDKEEDPEKETHHDSEDEYYNSFGKTLGTATAVIRKMYKLRSADQQTKSNHKISLVALITLQGVDIHITTAVNSRDLDHKPLQIKNETIVQNKSQASNFIASYIEAAMNSLKLNVQVSNIRLHLSTHATLDTLLITLQSATYTETPSSIIDFPSKTHPLDRNSMNPIVLQKNLQLSFLHIDLVSNKPGTETILCYNGKVIINLASYFLENDDSNDTKSTVSTQHLNVDFEHNIEFFLHNHMLSKLIQSFHSPENQTHEGRRPNKEQALIDHAYTGKEVQVQEDDDDDEKDAGILAMALQQREEALHRASTKQLRGGVLVPSVSIEEGKMNITYDAFFDANDYSYSQYRNLGLSLMNGASPEMDKSFTNVSIHVTGIYIHVTLSPDASHGYDEVDEIMVLSLREWSMESSNSPTSLIRSIRILDLDLSEDIQGCFYSILHFEKIHSEPTIDSDIIESDQNSLAFQVTRKRSRSETLDETTIIASLPPITLYFRQATLTKLIRVQSFFEILNRVYAQREHQLQEGNTSCIIKCAWVKVNIPLSSSAHDLVLNPLMFSQMLDRCTYVRDTDKFIGDHECSLEWMIDHIQINADRKTVPASDDIVPLVHLNFKCLRSLASLSVPFTMNNGHAARMVFDIFVLDSDTLYDSKAVIIIDYTVIPHVPIESSRRKWTKKYFPWITPLASVKATQDQDLRSMNRGGAARCSDPQAAMFSDACECDRNILLYMPHIIFDVSTIEILMLQSLVLSYFQGFTKKVENRGKFMTQRELIQDAISFTIRSDLITLATHLTTNDQPNSGNFSFMLALERVCFHSLHHVKQNTRLVVHDFSLFEAIDTPDFKMPLNTPLQSLYDDKHCAERCKAARERRGKIKGNPFVFRSKRCQPLSPKTPAIVIDILENIDVDLIERKLYINLYDATVRCDSITLNLSERLTFVCGIFKREDKTASAASTHAPEEAQIIQCFFTVSDCGIDFITPCYFKTGSSVHVRIGEIRVSSNILTPPGPIQTINVSFSDVGLFLSNERISFKLENSFIICSNLFAISMAREPSPNAVKQSFEEVMGNMNFIALLNIDSFDVLVTKNSITNELSSPSTISLAIGRISLYACRDSFRCFVDTAGELVLVLTSSEKKKISRTVRSFTNPTSSAPPITMKNAIADCLFSNFQSEEVAYKNNFERNISASSPKNYQMNPSDCSWTTVDYRWSQDDGLTDGIEQSTRWYQNGEYQTSTCLRENATVIVDATNGHHERFKIFPQHISQSSSSQSLCGTEAYLSALSGKVVSRAIKFSILVTDMALVVRFFDGYDWSQVSRCDPKHLGSNVKKELLDELLTLEDDGCIDSDIPFDDMMRHENNQITLSQDISRKRRQPDIFFQIQLTGIKARIDSFHESNVDGLSSLMTFTVTDLLLAERLNSKKPMKVVAEWVSEKEHPRDTKDGMIMLNMLTLSPSEKFSSDDEIMSDEAQAILELLPIRCFFHQHTLTFMNEFLSYITPFSNEGPSSKLEIEPPPPTFFKLFKVKPVKLKIDYIPERINTAALKDGSFVELLNILPIEDMVLRLNALELRNLSGWGSIMGEIINLWLQNITTNQMHKFITRTSPLQPLASVGEGVKEMIMLPLEEYRQGGDVRLGIRRGATDLAEIVAYETVKVTGRLTRLAAKTLDRTTETSNEILWSEGNNAENHAGLSSQALDSISRGLKQANAKLIVIPYREYQRCGPKGAVKTVLKGLPVAVCAPLSGAAEALSLALEGLCDHLRPDQKNELDANTD